jgi:ribosomal protein L14E/L6E/L27E
LGRDFAPLTEEWVFSGAKHGWSLRLRRKKRAVLYLKPLEQNFRVSLALGPRAVDAARTRRLSADVLHLIDEAVEYPEGKAIRFEVRGLRDIRVAIQLAAIKLES